MFVITSDFRTKIPADQKNMYLGFHRSYSVHFSRVGVKIELLDREEDSLDERPLWSTLDPTWCVFILTDGSAFETQPLRTFCGGSQEPLERKDVLP